MRKICIVTPDTVGPIKNGGIGTHAYFLSRVLAGSGDYEVTVLFTGPVLNQSSQYWREYYRGFGVTYLDFNLLLTDFVISEHSLVDRSLLVLNYMRGQDFDAIHFQEWQANGFHTIQAKSVGGEFAETSITVMMHSSTQWISEGMRSWNYWPETDPKTEWCERYCCQHADVLISPSEYMFDWALSRNWSLSGNRRVLNCCYQPYLDFGEKAAIDTSHLIFFGRLENRKGLKLFVQALLELEDGHKQFKKISFLGKIGLVDNQPADEYLRSNLASFEYQIHDDFDSFEALRFINDTGGIAVIPSLVDNFPYTVSECIVYELPFIAAKTGGIPEQCDESLLFELPPVAMADKLRNLESIEYQKLNHPYNCLKASEAWLGFHRDLSATKKGLKKTGNPDAEVDLILLAKGKVTPVLIDNWKETTALSRSSYLLVNDELSENEKEYLRSAGLRICQIEESVARTINSVIGKLDSDFILVANLADKPAGSMVDDLVTASLRKNLDAVTCHDTTGKDQPIGALLETICFENVLCRLPLLFTREKFECLGGFDESLNYFLPEEYVIRLLCANGNYDVVPKELITILNRQEYTAEDVFQLNWVRCQVLSSQLPVPMRHFLRAGYMPAITGFSRVLGKLRATLHGQQNQKD